MADDADRRRHHRAARPEAASGRRPLSRDVSRPRAATPTAARAPPRSISCWRAASARTGIASMRSRVWHYYAGSALTLAIADDDGARSVRLGPDLAAGEVPQADRAGAGLAGGRKHRRLDAGRLHGRAGISISRNSNWRRTVGSRVNSCHSGKWVFPPPRSVQGSSGRFSERRCREFPIAPTPDPSPPPDARRGTAKRSATFPLTSFSIVDGFLPDHILCRDQPAAGDQHRGDRDARRSGLAKPARIRNAVESSGVA